MFWPPGALAALLAAAGLALAACGGSAGSAGSPHVASLGGGSGTSSSGSGTTTTAQPQGNATKLVDEWAACERSHGDPSQPDPVIDSSGVINITIPKGAVPAGDPHDLTGTCSQYLTAAQTALRAAYPDPDPQGVSQAEYLKYVDCMRANGVPNYPYPTGNTTDFIGSGVDPDSPQVQRVNDFCGKKLGLPAWWITGTGPPGDVEVSTAGVPSSGPPACMFARSECGVGPAKTVPGGNGGASGNG